MKPRTIDIVKPPPPECVEHDFNSMFPNCTVGNPRFYIGTGHCDGGDFNTEECDYDCNEFNRKYPFCPQELNEREGANNVVRSKRWIQVNHDDEFNRNYPSCPVEELSKQKGSEDAVLGDGFCDGGVYSISNCGYEGGDCERGQVGQDLPFNVFTPFFDEFPLLFSKLSLDGSTLAFFVRLPPTEHLMFLPKLGVRILRYDDTKRMWTHGIGDLDVSGEDYNIFTRLGLAMDKFGSRIIIASDYFVKVFDIDHLKKNAPFHQVGQTIFVGNYTDFYSYRVVTGVDITADGSRFAVTFNTFVELVGEDGEFQDAIEAEGKVQIYDLQKHGNKSEWIQVGDDVIFQNQHEGFGLQFLSLNSDDGSTVLFSVEDGRSTVYGRSTVFERSARVYAFNGTTWYQVGSDLPYTHFNSAFSTAAISGNGASVVVASANQFGPGFVQMYRVLDDNILPVGGPKQKSFESVEGDIFGYSLAFSNDGTHLAVASTNADCDSNDCGISTIDLFVYDPDVSDWTKPIFHEMFANRKAEFNELTPFENLRESHIVGSHLSFGRHVEYSTLSNSTQGRTFLSVISHNVQNEEGYIIVYDLDERFYTNCRVDDETFQYGYMHNDLCDVDTEVNTPECCYDTGACLPLKQLEGYPNCFIYEHFISYVGDGYCDEFLNTKECNFDGGDCAAAATSEGSEVLESPEN